VAVSGLMSTKTVLVSDLHLDNHPLYETYTDFDIAIVAGDIANGYTYKRIVEELQHLFGEIKPIIYVPGNHEHYGRSVFDLYREAQIAGESNVHLLGEPEGQITHVTIDGIRFYGSTAWASLRNEDVVIRGLNDFVYITEFRNNPFKFRDYHNNFVESVVNRERFKGVNILVTHHLLSMRSVNPKYVMSNINGGFVSDREDLLEGFDYYFHGHTHEKCMYDIDGTVVGCNPRGYTGENPYWGPMRFDF
jgi:3',5'-cyclic AMP phosphodiesterase CpdA